MHALAHDFQTSGWLLRPYVHSDDHAQIVAMCSDVYGGTDYLPDIMAHYSQDPSTSVIVAANPQDGALGGVVCCDVRGSAVFLFGLRVDSKHRGKGLAHLLMGAIIAYSKDTFPQARAVLSTTLPSNLASVALMVRHLSPAPIQMLDHWPMWETMAQFEETFNWPTQQAGPSNNILEFIPGAMAVLKADAEAMSQLSRWRPANSLQEAQRAVQRIKGEHPGSAQPQLLDWLPGKYEVLPLDSAAVAQALAAGQLWVLEAAKQRTDPDASGSGDLLLSAEQPTYLGVLVVYYSLERHRHIAGILAAVPSAVHSGLMAVAQRVLKASPHFVGFIERGPGCAEPSLYQVCAPRTGVVYGRLMK